MRPTAEQEAIREAFATGEPLAIEAGAGAGKTSTLRLLATDAPRRRGLFLAYNRQIKDDAASSFPSSVKAMTTHGLAYGPVAIPMERAGKRVGGSRQPAYKVAQILGIREPLRLDKDTLIAPDRLARYAAAMVAGFCKSGDHELTGEHLPVLELFAAAPAAMAEIRRAVLPYARRAWSDIASPAGLLRFDHDHYLKLYQLSRPKLRYDYILVDEAQDLNPCVAALVADQDMQVVYVGDRCQAINGWNGAVDAMETAPGRRLYLSQSFRFGPEIAAEANKWLRILRAELVLRGTDRIRSRVEPLDAPASILCRSNATALARAVASAESGRATALVGKVADDLGQLAKAAIDLAAGRGTDHPELLAFGSWQEVQAYAISDPGANDLKRLVDLVDKYTAEKLLVIVQGLTDEAHAEVVVSTAHRSKGREWSTVQVADDFYEPKPDDDGRPGRVGREQGMLAYVTVTRAREVLDRSGLSWVDDYVPGAYRRAVRGPLTDMREQIAIWPDDQDETGDSTDEAPAVSVTPVPAYRRCTPDTCVGVCDQNFPDRCLWPAPVLAGAAR